MDSIALISRSPLGKLAPGNAEIDKVFKDMWVEAEKNRTKWSCESQYRPLLCGGELAIPLVILIDLVLYSDLGRTATLFDISDSEGITTFWISYWKDLKGLQEFATSSAHSLGQNAYLKKKYPYMGVMHETYHSPKGSWETIYDNVPRLGLGKWSFRSCSIERCILLITRKSTGNVKYVVGEGPMNGYKLGDTLKPSPKTSTMYSRMGRDK